MSDTYSEIGSVTESEIGSVTESVTGSVTVAESLCEEINELLKNCEDLYNYIHNSSETLKNIHSLVENHQNITVTYKGIVCDFEEVIESVHLESLQNINHIKNNFGEKLLEAVDNSYFH